MYIKWTYFGCPGFKQSKSSCTVLGSSAPSQYVAMVAFVSSPLRLPTINVTIGNACNRKCIIMHKAWCNIEFYMHNYYIIILMFRWLCYAHAMINSSYSNQYDKVSRCGWDIDIKWGGAWQRIVAQLSLTKINMHKCIQ